MHRAKLLTLIFITLLMFNFGCGGNQTTSGSVGRDPIADLPDYPGSTRTAYTTGADSAGGFSKTVKAEMKTNDPMDKVIEFYKLDNLSKNGWKPVNVESSSASADDSRVTISLSKSTSVAKVILSEKGKGNVTISVERKDK